MRGRPGAAPAPAFSDNEGDEDPREGEVSGEESSSEEHEEDAYGADNSSNIGCCRIQQPFRGRKRFSLCTH